MTVQPWDEPPADPELDDIPETDDDPSLTAVMERRTGLGLRWYEYDDLCINMYSVWREAGCSFGNPKNKLGYKRLGVWLANTYQLDTVPYPSQVKRALKRGYRLFHASSTMKYEERINFARSNLEVVLADAYKLRNLALNSQLDEHGRPVINTKLLLQAGEQMINSVEHIRVLDGLDKPTRSQVVVDQKVEHSGAINHRLEAIEKDVTARVLDIPDEVLAVEARRADLADILDATVVDEEEEFA